VLGGSAAFLALVLGIFGFGYYHFVYYKRTAHEHVPRGAVAAFRLDVEQAVLFAPFRAAVLPVLERSYGGSALAGGLAALEADTGLQLALDLREIQWAVDGTGERWTLAIGGKFSQDGLLAGLGRWISSRGLDRCQPAASLLRCSRMTVGMTADGLVIFADSPATLSQALAPSNRGQELESPPKRRFREE
jgi:hypothetical protein